MALYFYLVLVIIISDIKRRPNLFINGKLNRLTNFKVFIRNKISIYNSMVKLV